MEPTVRIRSCPNCGSPVNAGAAFCNNCAAPLGGYGPARSGSNRNVIIISAIAGGVVLIGAIILIVLLATGSSGPGGLVKDGIRALEKNDPGALRDLYAKDALTLNAAKAMAENDSRAIKAKKGIKSVDIKKEDIDRDGKNASVEYEIRFGDDDKEAKTATLVKEDGRWKIVSIY